MTAAAVVVGIGQAAAGDDGVGLAVARELSARGLQARQCADASVVLTLLGEGRRVVVVDAIVGGGPPGAILRLDPGALGSGPVPLSSHGLGVAEAIELARTLYGDAAVAGLSIVGIAIDRPTGPSMGLSAAVAASVEPASDLAATLAQE
jgi:hydrogenase maturation protease